MEGEYRTYEQNNQSSEVLQTITNQSLSAAVQPLPPPPPPPPSQQQQQQPSQPQPPPQSQPQPQQQPRPPSPRKSMFDFVSPFDHLSNQVKKKPVPAQLMNTSTAHEENATWVGSTEAKHQSVDNLLEHLTRSTQASQTQNTPPAPPAYDSYLSGSDFSQGESAVTPQRAAPPPPLPPKPVQRAASPPRSSPPKSQSQRSSGRSEATFLPSPHQAPSIAGSVVGSRRGEKESSPGPRGGYRGKAKTANVKSHSSPRFVHTSVLRTTADLCLVHKCSQPSSTFHSRWKRYRRRGTTSSRLLLL